MGFLFFTRLRLKLPLQMPNSTPQSGMTGWLRKGDVGSVVLMPYFWAFVIRPQNLCLSKWNPHHVEIGAAPR